MIDQIQFEIEKLKKQYIEKYGYTLFEIMPIVKSNHLLLKGIVLLPLQSTQLMVEIQKFYHGDIENQIRVAIIPEDQTEIRWGFLGVKRANIFRYFPPSGKKKVLSSQIISKTDPFRILAAEEGWLLIQLIDYTSGWLKEEAAIQVIGEDFRHIWQNVERVLPDKTISISIFPQWQFEKFMNVRYVWGGTSEVGIDCSGLMQRIFRDSFNIIIPKNSYDQQKCGVSIPLTEIKMGDLLFLQGKWHHVAVFLSEDAVIHASLTQHKVVKESLSSILRQYQLEEVRRFVTFQNEEVSP